jgi:hypothetical protein
VFSSESLEIKKMRRGGIIRTRREKTGEVKAGWMSGVETVEETPWLTTVN